MRDAFWQELTSLGKRLPTTWALVPDISPIPNPFKEAFPERFVNVGVAESAMIGIAAGLALKGKRPFCYTIANFALYRPFEFVRNDLAFQNLPVVVCGMGSGVGYANLGSTHHTMEDVQVASAIPGLRVLAPADPYELRAMMGYLSCAEGPTYLRIGKRGEPQLPLGEWEYNLPRMFNRGSQKLIVAYGPVSGMAWEVAKELDCNFASWHTLKPLNEEFMRWLILSHEEIVVVEEHVAWLYEKFRLYDNEIRKDLVPKIRGVHLKDEYIKCYGTHTELLYAHGVTAEAIKRAFKEL